MVDLKLEVVVLPVSDVDRAECFYEALGFPLDADFVAEGRPAGGAVDTARLGMLGRLRRPDHLGTASRGYYPAFKAATG
jgi:catechol 2,3-dioxygenase-like lactoylglutathione lyase family enzyme